jgi:hypothetical protein
MPEPTRNDLSDDDFATVVTYARGAFVRDLTNLLDDPSELLEPLRDAEPAETLAQIRSLANLLGFDYDELVAMYGSDYERERIGKIETGAIAPKPRHPRLTPAKPTES